MLSIHTMEYYLSIKRNKVLIHATTQMDHENTVLSEGIKLQKATPHYPITRNVQHRHGHDKEIDSGLFVAKEGQLWERGGD